MTVYVEAIPARTARVMFDIFTHFSGPHFAFCHCLYQHNAVGMTTPKIASALFSRSWEPWRCLDLTWITGGTMLRLSNTYIIHNPTHCILFLVFFFFFFFFVFPSWGLKWFSLAREWLETAVEGGGYSDAIATTCSAEEFFFWANGARANW